MQTGRCAAWAPVFNCSFSVSLQTFMHEDTSVCNVPRRPLEAATVTRWDQECRPPRFFDLARLRLCACAVGQHAEVTSNDVYVVQLCNFPELTQKLSRNSSPLRGSVARTKRGPSHTSDRKCPGLACPGSLFVPSRLRARTYFCETE